MINPIELLKLNYYELERISPEIIEQAIAQLRAQAGLEGIVFQGQALSFAEAEALAERLKSPQQLAYYYQLCKYPGLSSLLAGDDAAAIEAEALRQEDFSTQLIPHLRDIFSQALARALESGRPEAIQRLGAQLAQGTSAFQAEVFQPSLGILAGKQAELEDLAQSLQDRYSEEAVRPLRGLQQLRAAYPIPVFNALPPAFGAAREGLARALGKIVHAIWKEDAALALAVARYARQLEMSSGYAQKLEQASALIQSKAAKAQKAATARKNRPWHMAGGLILLLLLLAGLGLGLRKGYDVLTGFFYEPSIFDLKELEESGIERDEIERLQQLLEKKGSLSREDLEAIIGLGDGGTQIVEHDVLQLPWPERGQASEQPLSGQAELGSAPMAACFPPKGPQGKREQQIAILGDAHFDALVFFFNGRDYIQQAFLPAKSQYVLKGKMDEQQVISTMIVFGKNWDPAAASPCGTPGYFTQNIHYSGFAGYALDPVYPDLRSDLSATLKKNRLLPSRELQEKEFFDLLEKYR